ncbi:glycoside hydrolase family 16 protein [Gelidibacter salicanalis]|uniref:Glycoside hydrolase family 16 protein n=1 Tax=Gelidibacter salicanalis TaxID=291193 RepID=A0A934KIW0_9FLAO|nr:glycoside hydrolase family 16 protein [Gelidibacter salicanalis]MBJ7879832.1 glycoside hydrolase family 16 protein [Gelidibacter salicanalis]
MNTNFMLSRLGILLLLCGALQSCSVSKPIKENSTEAYQLVFEDQFNGSAYSTRSWSSFPEGVGTAPWNRYVKDDADLAEVKDGNLYMKARWNTDADLPETGAIQTKDKYSFKYGKIEVRAKFNSSGQGGWPAIWLMPQNDIYPGWPNGGEIDIMERLNTDSFVHQVVHQTNGEAKHNSTGITQAISPAEYNTYGIIKKPNRIEFYVNDKLTMVHEPTGDFEKRWPFETDYYIILNHATADKGQAGVNYWPGLVKSIVDFPYEMAIDYVKVWEFVD